VGTAKRERQKANRQLRLEELAKQARKDKTKRFSLRVGLALVSVVALVGVLYLLNGGDDEATSASTSTTTTIALAPAPEKPTVEKPAGPVTELKVTALREGDGDVIVAGDTIDAYYVGITASDGVEFEENYTTGTGPATFAVGVGRLIQGWDQGLVGLKAGGQYRLDIPVGLAYGADAAANGKPAGDLTFVIDVVGVTPGEPVASTTTVAAAESTTTSLPAPATT
jgi:peptidylprolyl isomerase